MKKRLYNIKKGDLLKIANEFGVSHSTIKQISTGKYPSKGSELYKKVHRALLKISNTRNEIESLKASLV